MQTMTMLAHAKYGELNYSNKPKFKKTVYISKVGIYDEEKNLIGIAKVATPVRKQEDHDYTFKLKLDI